MAPAAAHRAIEAGFAAIADIHRLMSFHDAGSDVSALNRGAHSRPIAVDERTVEVIRRALKCSAASDGAFDITVAPQLVRWGYLPSPAAAHTPPRGASWRDIELLEDGRIRFHRPLWIDLGGIAKGYAVDQALERMAIDPGVGVCINAGGDLRVEGPEAWPIRLAAPSPSPDASVPLVRLTNGSLASSSGAEASRICGRRRVGPHVGPIRPGRVRRAMGLRRFVTVLARDCMTADALTKVVMAQGMSAAPLLADYRASALIRDAGAEWQQVGADWRDSGAHA